MCITDNLSISWGSSQTCIYSLIYPPHTTRTHELRILFFFKLCVLKTVCLPIRSISFFFTAVWYSVMWMYHDSWSKCPTGGHVGSFLSFAFTNNAMHTVCPAYCPLSIYPADKVVCIQFCLQGKLIKGMCIWYLDRNCKSSSQCVWKCPLPWILYNTIVCLFCSNKKCSHILVCIQLWVNLFFFLLGCWSS